MTPEGDQKDRRSYLRLADVSDSDGTREGGLVFCLSLIVGMIVAQATHPSALTSFWVWFALLAAACGIAFHTQKLVAWAMGHRSGEAE